MYSEEQGYETLYRVCAVFENSLTHCPQCGRLLVKDKKSPRFFVITVLAITLAILCGVLISFSPIMAA